MTTHTYAPFYRNHNPVLSLIMTYHRVCYYGNTTGAPSEAGTSHASAAPQVTPDS
jgi:hypothetical protein